MNDKIKVTVFGVTYFVDSEKSQLLHRGLIDPYDKSKQPNEWVVLMDYAFWSHDLQRIIIIPRWFSTDLASVPKIFRSFISVNERHRLASLPHDMLYTLSSSGQFDFPRKMADTVLLTFCKVMGVPTWKRWAMYLAVRAGGWSLFGKANKRMFIPSSHRIYYSETFPSLNLNLEDGKYLPVMK